MQVVGIRLAQIFSHRVTMRRRLPPLNAIRSFEAVARHQHLGHAAAELCVSHSALSQQVKRLEEWFGAELFLRDKGRLILKPEGQKLLSGYSKALDKLEDTSQELMQEVEQRHLVIQCDPAFFSKFLMRYMPALREVAGNTIIDIVTSQSLPRHFPDDIDIAIHFAGHPEWHNLHVEHLVDIHGFPACNPDLLQHYPDHREPRDLVHMPLLHGDDRGSWNLWLTKYAGATSAGCNNTYYDDFSLTIRAAVIGEGALIADPILCREELESGNLVPLFNETILEVSYSAFCPNQKYQRRIVRKVYDRLLSVTRQAAMEPHELPASRKSR